MFRLPLPKARPSLAAMVSATLAALAMTFWAPAAEAGPGYQPASTNSSIGLAAELPVGVAVDQVSQRIYVAELSANLFSVAPGQVEQLDASGTPTANSPFTTGGEDLFTAVAVNPVTQGIYAYQIEGSGPAGHVGVSRMNTFSSAGAPGTFFGPASATPTQLAADSSGRVYYPNNSSGTVQVFSSSGVLESSISCAGCIGGNFNEPSAVAFDSAGKLYVVDRANGRVIVLAPSGGGYSYQSTLQSGKGAVTVGVDPSSNDVFVGAITQSTYHVVAYNSSGIQFDDFAAGLASKGPVEAATGQLAVNATTHRVYLSNPGGNALLVFERIASIPAPTASIVPPSPVGQLGATLKATVNPKGHVLSSCQFEYTDHADFQANGYANAESAPCPPVLGGPESTSVPSAVSGLTPSTSYDYRILVSSNGGSAESSTQSFETLPPLPPDATTGTPSAITQTTATLAGSVNARGGPISNCHFEYTNEASFQASGFTGAISKACSLTPSGTTSTAVTAKITGLIASGSYRFRVVATNNSGTTNAVEKTFAALADTCQTNPAVCPPPSGGGSSQPPVQQPSLPPPVTTLPPTVPVKKPLKCKKGFKKKRVHGKTKCVKVRKHKR